MALDTYANLQLAIADWMMRPGDSTIAAIAPDLIALFEEEARDRLRTLFNEATANLVTVAGLALSLQPAYFGGLREAVLQTSPSHRLTYLTPEQADDTFVDGETGAPRYITIKGSDFYLYPTPDAAYTIAIDYVQGLPALSAGGNWLFTNYPSLYLYGALAEAGDYIDDDGALTKYLKRREAGFDRVLLADRKKRWSGGPLQIKTDTGNP